jgi:hypothetical protein
MVRRDRPVRNTWLRTAWWCLKAPVVFGRALARLMVRVGGTVSLIGRDAVRCRACGETVSLVARFECGWCGYVFDGFAFARCEVCGAVPPFIECQACGAGVRNPSFI